MRSIVSGGLAALIALQVLVGKGNQQYQDKAASMAAAASDTRSERMLADMEKNTKNPIAWNWTIKLRRC